MTFASRFVVFAAMVIIFSGVAQAGNIIVAPTEYNVDLIGGDTITRSITITWTGETAVVGFIETDIAPDGEGIDITYSEDPIVLYPNIPNTINMTIATAINLAPIIYTITTLVFTEVEEVIEYRSRGGGTTTIYETIEIENITNINRLLDIIRQLKDELNATKDNCTEQILLLTGIIIDTLDAIVDSIEDMQQEPEEAKEDKWLLEVILAFIIFQAIVNIILIIAIFYLGYRIRVLESQRIKEIKENENENK